MNSPEQPGVIKNKERILRILQKICENKLAVYIRADELDTQTIRAKASQVTQVRFSNAMTIDSMVIKDLSAKAIELLPQAKELQVEFIMTSIRLVFATKLLAIKNKEAYIAVPKALHNIERRQELRSRTSEKNMAYLKFFWENPKSNVMPIFSHYEDISNIAPVFDISKSGICIATKFPLLNQYIESGDILEYTQLILPMEFPHPAQVSIRWFRKVEDSDSEEKTMTSYRYGCLFIDPHKELQKRVQRFIRTLLEEDTV